MSAPSEADLRAFFLLFKKLTATVDDSEFLDRTTRVSIDQDMSLPQSRSTSGVRSGEERPISSRIRYGSSTIQEEEERESQGIRATRDTPDIASAFVRYVGCIFRVLPLGTFQELENGSYSRPHCLSLPSTGASRPSTCESSR